MKRRNTSLAALGMAAAGLLAAIAGCDALGVGSDPAPTPTPSATASTPAGEETPPPPADGAREVREQTDTFLFEYSYPKEAGEIPALAAWLDARLERERARLADAARQGRDTARGDGFPFNPYSSGTAWELVTDLPGWLSMSATLESYEGGAHGNFGFDTVVWDKVRGRAVEPVAFFTSPADLDRVLGARLCEALNAERAERRGAPVTGEDAFNDCVKPDETNLLLGSRGGERFDRIGIQIAPYIAGPWAEGNYEFDFAMDEDLLAIVRPEYREAFSARN